jgi:hypothetical protein
LPCGPLGAQFSLAGFHGDAGFLALDGGRPVGGTLGPIALLIALLLGKARLVEGLKFAAIVDAGVFAVVLDAAGIERRSVNLPMGAIGWSIGMRGNELAKVRTLFGGHLESLCFERDLRLVRFVKGGRRLGIGRHDLVDSRVIIKGS